MTQFEIESRPEDISNFMEKLPVQKLWGIGAKSAEKLRRLGVQTCSTTPAERIRFPRKLLDDFYASIPVIVLCGYE